MNLECWFCVCCPPPTLHGGGADQDGRTTLALVLSPFTYHRVLGPRNVQGLTFLCALWQWRQCWQQCWQLHRCRSVSRPTPLPRSSFHLHTQACSFNTF